MKPIILQGILYDEKSSFQKGPAKAPPIIRDCLHSDAYNTFSELGIDIDSKAIVDRGDFKISEYFDIEKVTEKHLKEDARICTLGGDHSITYPILKAYSKHHSNIHILQFDAHSDLYHEFEGDPYSHACPFARIMENKLANHLIQVGIRTLTTHQREQAQKFGVEIHHAKDIGPDFSLKIKQPVYLSVDMDVFDPAFAPGISHRESGGLTPRQIINLIHSIDAPIIGADIVEYNPDKDLDGITAALASKILKEVLAKMIGD